MQKEAIDSRPICESHHQKGVLLTKYHHQQWEVKCQKCNYRSPNGIYIDKLKEKIDRVIGDYKHSSTTQWLLDKIKLKLDSLFCHPDNSKELRQLLTKLITLSKTPSSLELYKFIIDKQERIQILIKERQRKNRAALDEIQSYKRILLMTEAYVNSLASISRPQEQSKKEQTNVNQKKNESFDSITQSLKSSRLSDRKNPMSTQQEISIECIVKAKMIEIQQTLTDKLKDLIWCRQRINISNDGENAKFQDNKYGKHIQHQENNKQLEEINIEFEKKLKIVTDQLQLSSKKIDHLETLKRSLENDTATLRSGQEKIHQQNQQLKLKNVTLFKQKQEKQEENVSLLKRLQQTERQLAIVVGSLEQSKKQIVHLEDMKKALEKDFESTRDLQQKLVVLEKVKSEQKARNNTIMIQLKKYKDQIENYQSKQKDYLQKQKCNKQIEKKLQDIQALNSELEKNNSQLQDKHAELTSKHSELEKNNSQLQDKHAELTSKHSELEKNNSQLQDKHAELTSKHSELEKNNSQLQDKHAELTSKHSELEKNNSQLQDKQSEFQETITEQQQKNKNLQFQYHKILSKLTTYQNQMSALENIIKGLRSKQNFFEQQLSQTSRVITSLKQRQQHLSTIENSLKLSLYLSRLFPNSQILSDDEQKLVIKNFFKTLSLEPLTGNLVFKMNGRNGSQFHSYCQNIPNLLLIAQQKQGKRFGGFSSQGWSKNPQECMLGFLFSLDRKQMLKLRQGRSPSTYDKAYGPIFGEGDLRIGLNGCGFSTVSTYTSSYEVPDGKMEPQLQKTFMAGSQEFVVISYQVYQIKF